MSFQQAARKTETEKVESQEPLAGRASKESPSKPPAALERRNAEMGVGASMNFTLGQYLMI